MQLKSQLGLVWQKILLVFVDYLVSLLRSARTSQHVMISLAQDFIVLMQLKSRLGLVWQKILLVFVDYLVNLLRSARISQKISPLQGQLFYLIALA